MSKYGVKEGETLEDAWIRHAWPLPWKIEPTDGFLDVRILSADERVIVSKIHIANATLIIRGVNKL